MEPPDSVIQRMQEEDAERRRNAPPPHTTVTHPGSFWGRLFGGDHEAEYRTRVPEGRTGGEFAGSIARRLARQPAPSYPRLFMPSTSAEPSADPQPVQTLGQPSHVSLVSDGSASEHAVDVSADPQHILHGVGGSAAGVSYLARPDEEDDRYVLTNRTPYGQPRDWTRPARSFFGNVVLERHTQEAIDREVNPQNYESPGGQTEQDGDL